MPSPSQDPTRPPGPLQREHKVLERIGKSLGATQFKVPAGELWFGDDAAVLHAPLRGEALVFCTDTAVDGVHADLAWLSPADLGYRAVAATLSDIAAMGGRPWRMVVTVSSTVVPVTEIMDGVIEASVEFDCPVVGGDVTASPVATVTVAAIGLVEEGSAVNRAGARSGDLLFITGPLGASAAGLRAVRAGRNDDLVEAHRRPLPRLSEGRIAASAGATAMIDISDGLGLDLDRLALASNVGARIASIPIARGATRDDAMAGGEDYELLFTAPDAAIVESTFIKAGLRSPLLIGRMTPDPAERLVEGRAFTPEGWNHDVS